MMPQVGQKNGIKGTTAQNPNAGFTEHCFTVWRYRTRGP